MFLSSQVVVTVHYIFSCGIAPWSWWKGIINMAWWQHVYCDGLYKPKSWIKGYFQSRNRYDKCKMHTRMKLSILLDSIYSLLSCIKLPFRFCPTFFVPNEGIITASSLSYNGLCLLLQATYMLILKYKINNKLFCSFIFPTLLIEIYLKNTTGLDFVVFTYQWFDWKVKQRFWPFLSIHVFYY